MERFLKSLFVLLMRLWSRIYTHNLSQWFIKLRDFFYTLWIQNFLGDFGDKSRIQYPIRLQGGGSKRIHVGERTGIQAYCILGAWKCHDKDEHYEPEIYIGNDCSIGEWNQITAINKITIGDGLLTGRFVYIGDNAHGGLSWEEADTPPAKRHLKSKGEIMIGRNVWIGDKVTILGGVTIGDNVIIGANSIVTHDIPSNSMAAGAPAKVIKQI